MSEPLTPLEKSILSLLERETLHGATISKRLKKHRLTINKWLMVLEAKNLIKYNKVGNAKLWGLKK